jgi:hypothetical protein
MHQEKFGNPPQMLSNILKASFNFSGSRQGVDGNDEDSAAGNRLPQNGHFFGDNFFYL